MNKTKRGKLRSKLEYKAYDALVESNLDFSYEPFTITLVDSVLFEPHSWEKIGSKRIYKPQRKKVQPIRYTPDFVGKGWVIETKGYQTPRNRVIWKLFKNWLVTHNLNWALFMPSTKKEIETSIEIIKSL